MMKLLLTLMLSLLTVALGFLVYGLLFAIHINYYFFRVLEIISYD